MLQRIEFLRLSALLGLGLLSGCAAQPDAGASSERPTSAPAVSSSADGAAARVVAGTRSLAQMAILAGMPPVGVTEDATDLDGLPQDVATVGTAAHPSLEKIVALAPTLVLITAEVPAQKELEAGLDGAGIAWRDVDVNGFGDYAAHMQALTEMSGRNDLYQANVAERLRRHSQGRGERRRPPASELPGASRLVDQGEGREGRLLRLRGL